MEEQERLVYTLPDGRKKYIPQNLAGKFEQQYPTATQAYQDESGIYDISVKERDAFLKDFPNAKLYNEQQQQQPAQPQQTEQAAPSVPSVPSVPGAEQQEQQQVQIPDSIAGHKVPMPSTPQIIQRAEEKKRLADRPEGFDEETEQMEADKDNALARIDELYNAREKDLRDKGLLRVHNNLNDPYAVPKYDMPEDVDYDAMVLKQAKRMYSDAEKTRNAAQKGKGGFGRGLADSFTVANWDMGISDFQQNAALLTAAKKLDKGEPVTEAESMLLDAAAHKMFNDMYYGNFLGRGYKAGLTTGQSLPFMLEFMANPVSGTAEGGGSVLGRALAKKLGDKVAAKVGKEAVGSAVARGVGRGLGDLASSAIMTGSTGAVGTIADAFKRRTGDIKFRETEDGIKYDGVEGGEDTFFGAMAKAYGARTIENFSEMFGEYFSPIGRGASTLRKGAFERLGLSKVNDFIDNIGTAEWMQSVNHFLNKTHWDGIGGEFGEELVGGILNAITVGDQTVGEVFSKDNLIDTFLGVAAFGGFVSAIKTAGYRTPTQQLNSARKKQYEAGAKSFGDDAETWATIAGDIDGMDEGQLKDYLTTFNDAKEYTPEQEEEVFRYAALREKEIGIEKGKAKKEEEAPDMAQLDAVFEAAHAVEDSEEKRAIKVQHDKALADCIDAGLTDDDIQALQEDPGYIAFMQEGSAEETAARQYIEARAAMAGLDQQTEDRIQEDLDLADQQIAAKSLSGDGNWYEIQMKDGSRATLTGGRLAQNEDGTVDRKNSSAWVTIKVDGEESPRMVSTRDIAAYKTAPVADMRQQAEEQIRAAYRQQVAEEIDTPTKQEVADTLTGEEEAFDFGGETVMGTALQVNADGNVVVRFNEPIVDAGGVKRRVWHFPIADFVKMRQSSVTPSRQQGQEPLAAGAQETPVEASEENGQSGTQPEVESPAQPEQSTMERDFRGRPLPLRQDGKIDQKTLFQNDPEAWMEWNNRQRGDNGEDSRNYITGAISREEKKIADLQKKYDKADDFDERDELRSQMRDAQSRIDALQQAQENVDTRARMREARKNEPQSVDELVAQYIYGYKGSLDKEDFLRETGYTDADLQGFVGGFVSNNPNAVGVQHLAEIIKESDDTGLTSALSDMDIRNEILDVLGAVKNWGEVKNYVKNKRAAQAEEQRRMEQEAIEAAQQQALAGETPEVAVSSAEISEKQQEISEEEAKVDTNPTEAQKEAGNYRKGHIKLDGYDISIEQPKGSVRSGVDEQGTPWSVTMNNTYGYIRGTEGVDGDHIDVFLSDNPEEGDIFVVDQLKPDGTFDEHKVMYGFPDMESARQAYLSNYSEGWQGLGTITAVSREEFRKWVDSSHRKTKPFSEYASVKTIGDPQVDNSLRERVRDIIGQADGNPELADRLSGEELAHFANLYEAWQAESEKADEVYRENQKASVSPNKKVSAPAKKAIKEATEAAERAGAPLVEYYQLLAGQYGLLEQNPAEIAQTEAENEQNAQEAAQVAEDSYANRRYGQIHKKVDALAKALNTPIIVHDSAETIKNYDAYRALLDNETITGWYEDNTGEVHIYAPNIRSLKEAEQKVFHELVGHKGMRDLLGEEGYNEFCEEVWEMMDADERTARLAEVSHIEESRQHQAAADEYIARMAENVNYDPSVWNKIASFFRDIMRKLGVALETDDQDIAGMLRESYARLARMREAEVEEQTEQPSGAATIEPATYTTKRGKTLDMFLVRPNRELTKDEKATASGIAKESRGWYSREDGGFLMRDRETAQRLADALGNKQSLNDQRPLSMSDMRQTESAQVIEMQPEAKEEESELQFKYTLTTNRGGYSRLERYTVLANGQEIYDGNFDVSASNPDEMKGILQNNGFYDLLSDFDKAGLERSIERWSFDKRKQEDGFNGYRIGEAVRYTPSQGKRKTQTATIYDFEYPDGRPVLDAGLAPVMYEIVEWSDIEKMPKEENAAPAQEERPVNPSGNKLVTDEQYADLRRRMMEKLKGQMNLGIDPEILSIGVQMAVYHIEKGARKFVDYAKAMVLDLGDAIRPYLKAFYNGARELPEMDEAGYAADMDSYDDVRGVDVSNLDENTVPDLAAVAQTAAKENEAEKQADEAKGKLKKVRKANEQKSGDDAKARELFTREVAARMLEATVAGGEKPFKSIVELRRVAEQNGMKVDSEGQDDILLQELVENGLVIAARDLLATRRVGGAKSKTAFDAICRMYDMQPTISMRSSNRVKMQQYSTPLPMSFVADMFAYRPGVTKSVLEPTAGNGMLVIGVPAEIVHANELDETRLENLRQQGFAQVTSQDGAQPFAGRYDAVIANPPFGNAAAKEYDGKNISGLDPQIALNALASMADDGRAAIIIGGNLEYKPNGAIKSKTAFFTYLYDHYNVKGIVDMSGDLYRKQGTTFPTMMILIDGRRSEAERAQSTVYPPVKNAALAKVNNYDELYDTVSGVLNSKEKTNGYEVLRTQEPSLFSLPGSTGDSLSDNSETSGKTDGRRHNQKSDENGTDGRNGGTGEAVGGRSGGETVNDGTPDVRDIAASNVRAVLGAGVPAASDGRGDSAGTGAPADRGGRRSGGDGRVQSERVPADAGDGSVVRLSQERKEVKRSLEDEKLSYIQHSQAFSLQSVAPAAMVEAMDRTLTKIEQEHGAIDEFVRKELGYDTIEEAHNALAAEQMDSVAMAIYQMSQGETDAEGNRTGGAFIIGDQTGIGKGRQMAALIRWAVKNGKKPIFMTEKAHLFSDIYRDLVDVGSGNLRPFIFNSDGAMTDANGNKVYEPASKSEFEKIAKDGVLPNGYDFAVLTYSQVNTGDDVSRAEAHKGTKKRENAKKPRPDIKASLVRQLARDNYLFLDESQNAAGDSNAGAYMQSILKSAKGVTFASATFAKRPDTMPIYALRTAMSQANLGEGKSLIGIIAKGGVTLQEIMSRAMTEAGQYVRRERDMRDVRTDWVTVEEPELVDKTRKAYDAAIRAFNDIISFQHLFIEPYIESVSASIAVMAGSASTKKGTKDFGVNNPPFVSKTYNYTKQILFALKAQPVVDRVVREIEEGKHPVIAVESTMESFIKEYPAGTHLKGSDITFAKSLLRGLDAIMQYTVTIDGEDSHRRIDPSELGTRGEEAYYELQNRIRESAADISISPLDYLISELKGKGYRVGELTGREFFLEYGSNGSATIRKRGKVDKKKLQRDFNSGALDVLIVNKSGSTGISLHASSRFADQRQRTMIIAQPLSDINDYMQMIGRIDRTGQVHRGYYVNLALPVPAETRFNMMLATKLKSLNANTTTSQESESSSVDAPDLLNKYGSQVFVEYLRDNPEIYMKLGEPLKKGMGEKVRAEDLDEYTPKEDDALRLSGRVALLSTKEQDEFYKAVIQRYNDLIQYLDEIGANDLKITVMPLKAKTLERNVTSKGIDPSGENPFARDAYVERVEMDVLRKPMSAKEVQRAIANLNEGEDPGERVKTLIRMVETATNGKLEAEEARWNHAKEKAEADIKEKVDRINASTKRTDQEKRDAIEAVQSEVRQKVEETHQRYYEKILREQQMLRNRLKMFQAGRSYFVPIDTEAGRMAMFYSPAIFCGFKVGKDRITPSTSFAVFATLDGRQRVQVKFTDENLLQTIRNYTESNYDAAQSTTLDNWDASVPKETREEGYIMGGNILQAIADSEDEYGRFPGQLVSYTDYEGGVHDGILMPRGWEPAQLRSSGVPINARLSDILNGKQVTSTDGRVTIGMLWQGRFVIEVPKSKKDGAKFHQNEDILRLVDRGGFFQRNGKFMAYVQGNKIERLVNELAKMGVRVAEGDGDTHFSRADRDIAGAVSSFTGLTEEEVLEEMERMQADKDFILADTRFSRRTKPEPKKKGIGYKVFYSKDGKLYPPMVANPGGEATPVGVWLDADAAPIAGESKTGRPQVKAGGKGTQGGSGTLAYRPGWHLGEIPYASQFNRLNPKTGQRDLFPRDFVWAEVEYAMDNNYQQEADEEGMTENGKYRHSYAGLKRVPEDGFYRYRTNPNPETDPWIITGSMRVKKVLTNDEVDDLVRAAGREPQQREGDTFFSRGYHGSPYAFDEFDNSHMGEGEGHQSHGWGTYISLEEDTARRYAHIGERDRITYKGPVAPTFYAGEIVEFIKDEMRKGVPFADVKERMYDMLVKMEENRQKSGTYWINQHNTKEIEFVGSLTDADFQINDIDHNFYEVEIPDDTGDNYLDEDQNVLKPMRKKIAEALRGLPSGEWKTTEDDEILFRDPTLEKAIAKIEKGSIGGDTVYQMLSHGFRSKKVASQFLHDAGIVGIKYVGGIDGSCVVMFDDKDIKIVAHTMFSRGLNKDEGESDTAFAERCVADFASKGYRAIAKGIKVVEWKEGNPAGDWGIDDDIIRIFASQDSSYGDYEKVFFHENLHSFLNKVGVDGEYRPIREFLEFVHNLNPGKYDELWNEIASNERYKGKYEAEEMYVTLVERLMANGTAKMALNMMPKGSRGLLNNYFNAIRYDINRETEQRTVRDAVRGRVPDAEEGLRLVSSESGEEGRRGEGVTLFSRNAPLPDDAKGRYEARITELASKVRESHQDSMLSLKVLQEELARESGIPLEGFEDAYIAENHLSSINSAEKEYYQRVFMEPLIKSVRDLMVAAGIDYQGAVKYAFAKHGLERNEVFHDRDEQAAGKTIARRDYSGLTSLFKEDGEASLSLAEASRRAEDYVDQIEDAAPEACVKMWSKVKDATKKALYKSWQSGIMTRSEYEAVREMFDFYVPLRGFDEETAEQHYEYLDHKSTPFSPALRKAQGRFSVADDPFATIGNMWESTVQQGNNNLVKQKFLHMVMNRPSDLVSVRPMWYTYDAATDEWSQAVPSITGDMSKEDIQEAWDSFEQRMEAMEQQGLASKRKPKRGMVNIPYRLLNRQDQEHMVVVKSGGKDWVVVINGNPRAAQALNGLTNPDRQKFLEKMAKANRFLAANFTTRSPKFMLRNAIRDTLFSLFSVDVKEDVDYGRAFRGNLVRNYGRIWGLMDRFRKGEFDDVDDADLTETERLFREFMMNGGETGYTQLKRVDEYKKMIGRMIGEASGEKLHEVRNGLRAVGDMVGFANRCVEDICRLTAYMTSRQMGRDIQTSVANAKEISVNFNKKGSGEAYGSSFMRAAYLFYNAGVQGLYNFANIRKQSKGWHGTNLKKFDVRIAEILALGAVMPLLNNLISAAVGGDDDEYADLPDWIRRNNLVIGGGGFYVTLPLPIELRAIYGIGDIASMTVMGRMKNYTPAQLGLEVIGQVADIMPLNPVEGVVTNKGKNIGEGLLLSVVPDIVAPVAQAALNTDFTGKPIYKKNSYNEDAPAWTKAYAGTNKVLVGSAKLLSDITGGDEYGPGAVNINPAVVEHLAEGYLGGMLTFLNETGKTASMAWDEDMRKLRNVPFANVLLQKNDERTASSYVNDMYWHYKKEAELAGKRARGYRSSGDWERASRHASSDEWRRAQYFKEADKRVKTLQDELKETEDKSRKDELQKRIAEEKRLIVERLTEMD